MAGTHPKEQFVHAAALRVTCTSCTDCSSTIVLLFLPKAPSERSHDRAYAVHKERRAALTSTIRATARDRGYGLAGVAFLDGRTLAITLKGTLPLGAWYWLRRALGVVGLRLGEKMHRTEKIEAGSRLTRQVRALQIQLSKL